MEYLFSAGDFVLYQFLGISFGIIFLVISLTFSRGITSRYHYWLILIPPITFGLKAYQSWGHIQSFVFGYSAFLFGTLVVFGVYALLTRRV